MDTQDVCTKLSKAVQEATGVQELHSDNEFIKQMVTACLPKSKHCTVDSELKRCSAPTHESLDQVTAYLQKCFAVLNQSRSRFGYYMKYGAVFTLLLENFVNMPILCHFAVNILQTPLSEVTSLLSEKFVLLKFRTADKKHIPCVKKRLSLKQRRELGLYTINRTGMKYKDFEELHCLWKEYMRSCLGLAELEKRGFTGQPESKYWNQFSQLLLKADYHGANIKVVRSTCSSLVGQAGIVVFDTKNTFKIICRDNIVRTIPKQPSVFTMVLDDYTCTIHGKYFCMRPQDRSVKKIKTHMIADL